MLESIDNMIQRYADNFAAKRLDAAACLQQVFRPKEDPTSIAWREALESIKCVASFFGREEIPIYFQLLPPLQPTSLFSYYQGMQLEPRILLSTLLRIGAIAMVDYNFPSRPWIRRLTYTFTALVLMSDLFPSLMWPFLHSTLFSILKVRNVCLQSYSRHPL